MYHRVASFLLGCWILGSLFMMFVATENFGSVDRVLASAPPATIQAIGNEQARSVLRYMAGLENQLFFVTWERAQIVMSAALAAVFFFGLGSLLLSGLACALLLLTVVQHFWVTPVMIALSSHLDTAASLNQFGTLHAAYGIVEVLKLLIALVIAGLLLPAWRTRARTTAELEPIHHSR